MTHTQKLLTVFATLGVAAGGAYWLYLWLQDRDNAPTFTDLAEQAKSLVTRGIAIAQGDVGDVIGTSSYMDKARSLIAKQEGFSAKTYNDAGKLAIGYGHDIRSGDPYTSTSVISEAEASALLLQDMQSSDDCISSVVSVSLSDNQRAALISFVYNIGCGAFSSSTMLKKLNAGDFDGAADQFSAWVYATDPSSGQKVVNATLRDTRRPAEQNLFVTV